MAYLFGVGLKAYGAAPAIFAIPPSMSTPARDDMMAFDE
jgi:hypothetical protein